MDDKELHDFLEKYAKKEHTEEDHEFFVKWLQSAPEKQAEKILEKYTQYFEGLPEDKAELRLDLIGKIEASLDELEQDTIEPIKLWARFRKAIAIAASFLLISVLGIYFWQNSTSQQAVIVKTNRNEPIIKPGSNKAVLSLADGTQITLSDVPIGTISNIEGLTISKVKEGELLIKVTSTDQGTDHLNTITTPLGGQYSVVLPDGSHVWLNAASSLKFPSAFKKSERIVELSGEGYFEIAHINSSQKKALPFKVMVNNSMVEVLGTHFNIMAYQDEESTNTTLLEGSVRVVSGSESRLISPGQQARVSSNIQVYKVDANQAVAWKSGNFNFSHENIRSIMRKIARWYNVSIEYRGAITKEGFVGTMPRSESIEDVLNTLELTGTVHFKIEGRRIIVMP